MRFFAFTLSILTASAAFTDDKIDKNTVFFAAADVSNSTLDIVKTWYRIGGAFFAPFCKKQPIFAF